MQLVNLKQHRLIAGGFGPFVCTADKCLICPQYVVCCFWPDLLLRRMSKIEGTLECGVDTLPLITSGCPMLTSIKYGGKEWESSVCVLFFSRLNCCWHCGGFGHVDDVRGKKWKEMEVKWISFSVCGSKSSLVTHYLYLVNLEVKIFSIWPWEQKLTITMCLSLEFSVILHYMMHCCHGNNTQYVDHKKYVWGELHHILGYFWSLFRIFGYQI